MYTIHYPSAVIDALNLKKLTPKYLASTTTAATVLAAFYGAGFMTNSIDTRFLTNPADATATGNTENFQTISLTVHHNKDEILTDGSVSALEIEDAITEWAKRSDVAGKRGERIAIVSSVDRITETGVTIWVWDIIISTFVIYSYRRATANFGSEQQDMDADLQNLVNKIQSVNDQLTVTIY